MSQTTKVLTMLKRAGQRGVMNYEFPRKRILRYSARLGDLRNEGYNIIAERVKLKNRRSTNVFRYILIKEEE